MGSTPTSPWVYLVAALVESLLVAAAVVVRLGMAIIAIGVASMLITGLAYLISRKSS